MMDEIEEGALYEHHRLVIDAKQDLLRIDRFLMDKLPNVTRNKVQQGIVNGHVTVNKKEVKANYKIKPQDEILISFPTPPRGDTVIAENIPLTIEYEDKHLLVVNKPAGMVVHPAHQNWSGTLVNALAYHFENLPEMKGNSGRPGLVHRIDKDTSGLLVIAKDEKSMSGLAKQFFDHSIERTYIALIWGTPLEEEGTIHINVGRSLKDRRVTVAFPEGDFGKEAITHYKVLEDLYYVSLVKCSLETGRTHQIRAHMKYLKTPIFNDTMYGGSEILKGTLFTKYKQFVNNCFKVMPRQALHAKTLSFVHPITKKTMSFTSNLPDDFQAVLERWRKYKKID